jgi:hypothetical protein
LELPGSQGNPITIGLAGMSGKTAQRKGEPTYGNIVWAGLITAITRAQLNDAIALDPAAVVMIATDAVVATKPLALPCDDKTLGLWKKKIHTGMFIVQPGIYWWLDKSERPKTRGVPTSKLNKHKWRFEKKWRHWCERHRDNPLAFRLQKPPVVTVNLDLFIGLKLALARGKPRTAGSWVKAPRKIDFNWGRKRSTDWISWDGPEAIRSIPWPGSPDLRSKAYDGKDEANSDFDRRREEYEDQPDHIDLSPG